MSAAERIDSAIYEDREDQEHHANPRERDNAIAFNRASSRPTIVHETVYLPPASALARHRFSVEHDRLARINLHGAPRTLR